MSQIRLTGSLAVGCIFFILMLLSGCDRAGMSESLPEADEKHYQRAQRLLRESRNQEALGAFLKVVDKRRDAPESHLEVGRLYLEQMNDPVSSIYHFRKYLEYKPSTEQSPMVRQLIETAQKEFARNLPGQPFSDNMDRLDLLELLQQQRDENATLKREVATLKKRLNVQSEDTELKSAVSYVSSVDYVPTGSKSSRSTAAKKQAPPAPGNAPSAYTVQEGDTLTRISTKVYGNSGRWVEIFHANRDQLGSPHDLQPGQVLEVP
mgnify:CR=1 FL=1